MAIVVSVIFVIAYILISAEKKHGVGKAGIATLFAALLWLLIAIEDRSKVAVHIHETGAEIFEILVFLLTAMTLVEILVHYRIFDYIGEKLLSRGLSLKGQMIAVSGLAFLLSSVIDNLTTTLVLTQVARAFFKGKNLVICAALIVIAANAGGSFSPIGDVTTTMLWLGGKFSAIEIVKDVFLPALVSYVIAVAFLVRKLEPGSLKQAEGNSKIELSKSEKIVIGFAFGSFCLPFVFSSIGLRPYFGLLFGLGITWVIIDLLKRGRSSNQTHLTASIERLLQQTDIASLQFFVGILLAVAALKHLNILDALSTNIFGTNPSFLRLVWACSGMGLLSAIVDNIPLTAASMSILKTTDPAIWTLIAFTLGTGGSILVIGSAAGVVAMGAIKELTFAEYFKVAGLAAIVSYVCGISVWYLLTLI